MTNEDTAKLVSSIKWFHCINLPDGTITPGIDRNHGKLKHLHMPADMSGKTFLDIGAWDGFFSFEAERRGASRVLATDSFVWQGKVPGYSKEGFLAARKLLNSKVEDLDIDPLEVSPSSLGMWDIVLCAGVLYHLKHPWMLLQQAASVTRELLIFETCTDLRFTNKPGIALYPADELDGDHTNWCAPNLAAIRAMLRDCGFSKIDVVYHSGILAALRLWPEKFLKYHQSIFTSIKRGRAVTHARR